MSTARVESSIVTAARRQKVQRLQPILGEGIALKPDFTLAKSPRINMPSFLEIFHHFLMIGFRKKGNKV